MERKVNTYSHVYTYHLKLHTVKGASLEGLKFGESAKKSIWQKKVWQISQAGKIMHACCFIIDKFINHYMAEGILWNCLEATSRLQYWLTTCAHTHAHGVVAVTPLHKTFTQHRLMPLQHITIL